MKIVRNTPEQLILQNVPWMMSGLLALAILGMTAGCLYNLTAGEYKTAAMLFFCGPVFMGLFFAAFVQRDDLILDRSRNLIELRNATMFSRTKTHHDLTHLEKAVVQTKYSSGDGPSRTHQIALVLNGGTDTGAHPVTGVYTSGSGSERAADAINAWLGTA